MLLDSYVVLHAAFVSALHKLVGIEFGACPQRARAQPFLTSPAAAHFVQSTVASYERHLADARLAEAAEPEGEADTLGKEASNLIVLLSELYNFQVISCVLVYDVIRGLLDGDLTELKVELLLKITRSASRSLLGVGATTDFARVQTRGSSFDRMTRPPSRASSRSCIPSCPARPTP